MAKVTVEKSSLRLKSVLDVLTESVWSGKALNAGQVLAEATARVPFSTHEAELLSGGIPRGHKALTAATAKLVKAGWLVKGRSGWTITDDGMRATVAFPDADSFKEALDGGTPVPADTPIPSAPAGAVAEKSAAKSPAKRASAGQKAAQLIEDAVKPVVKAVRSRKAKSAEEAPAEAAANGTAAGSVAATEQQDAAPASGVESFPQPEAVAVAGDFNTLLGAAEDWAPQYDEAQLSFDALDQLWKKTAELPAGFYTFKIALNRSWDENYGAFGIFDGANHEVHHAGGPLTIRYDHRTRDITINS
ncbi:glycosidase [Pseudarthrobacter sp. J75]|uniref:pullulanase X25 domain-containing protein n=1 Tax=Pseudarthrobacter sp. J75 TaxID=3116486 RepID=UPI002E7FFEF2|nr:glycosidase [Pseudarthrobacter sp. J75]MEE2527535.1 glycosidase [Pseudarthrobacter sp. J75]